MFMDTRKFLSLGVAIGAGLLAGCTHTADVAAPEPAPAEPAPKKVKGTTLVFAWPFLEPEALPYRGGTTRGTEVSLETAESDAWKSLQADGLSALERDRRAILAMAGDYRVSFQFTETGGFVDGYSPSKPYFSWGTELVQVVESSDRFISLQHTLVMWFKDKEGNEHGPMVMKHWRQDWTYQDTDLHVYTQNSEWKRKRLAAGEVAGAWSQAVYQVDDSPRYEVVGRWQHGKGLSSWHSEAHRRPLPRREFSVRDDYNVLEGRHILTITPTGWVHEQHNRKLNDQGGSAVPTYLAQEFGVNRYERISSPSLIAGVENWEKTGAYWAAVRDTWKTVMQKHETFRLKSKYEDQKLFEHHFGYAAKMAQEEKPDLAAARKHARDTVHHFLVVP